MWNNNGFPFQQQQQNFDPFGGLFQGQGNVFPQGGLNQNVFGGLQQQNPLQGLFQPQFEQPVFSQGWNPMPLAFNTNNQQNQFPDVQRQLHANQPPQRLEENNSNFRSRLGQPQPPLPPPPLPSNKPNGAKPAEPKKDFGKPAEPKKDFGKPSGFNKDAKPDSNFPKDKGTNETTEKPGPKIQGSTPVSSNTKSNPASAAKIDADKTSTSGKSASLERGGPSAVAPLKTGLTNKGLTMEDKTQESDSKQNSNKSGPPNRSLGGSGSEVSGKQDSNFNAKRADDFGPPKNPENFGILDKAPGKGFNNFPQKGTEGFKSGYDRFGPGGSDGSMSGLGNMGQRGPMSDLDNLGPSGSRGSGPGFNNFGSGGQQGPNGPRPGFDNFGPRSGFDNFGPQGPDGSRPGFDNFGPQGPDGPRPGFDNFGRQGPQGPRPGFDNFGPQGHDGLRPNFDNFGPRQGFDNFGPDGGQRPGFDNFGPRSNFDNFGAKDQNWERQGLRDPEATRRGFDDFGPRSGPSSEIMGFDGPNLGGPGNSGFDNFGPQQRLDNFREDGLNKFGQGPRLDVFGHLEQESRGFGVGDQGSGFGNFDQARSGLGPDSARRQFGGPNNDDFVFGRGGGGQMNQGGNFGPVTANLGPNSSFSCPPAAPKDPINENPSDIWVCPVCDKPNFMFRTVCKTCGRPKVIDSMFTGQPAEAPKPIVEPKLPLNPTQVKKPKHIKPGDWSCIKCSNVNFKFRDICHLCQEPKPPEKVLTDPFEVKQNVPNQDAFGREPVNQQGLLGPRPVPEQGFGQGSGQPGPFQQRPFGQEPIQQGLFGRAPFDEPPNRGPMNRAPFDEPPNRGPMNQRLFDDGPIRGPLESEKLKLQPSLQGIPPKAAFMKPAEPVEVDLSQQEIEFDKMFRKWEDQFDQWKFDNRNNPDTEYVKNHIESMNTFRQSLILRRQKLRLQRIEAASLAATNSTSLLGPGTSASSFQKPTPTFELGSTSNKPFLTGLFSGRTGSSNIPGLEDEPKEKEIKMTSLTAKDLSNISKVVQDMDYQDEEEDPDEAFARKQAEIDAEWERANRSPPKQTQKDNFSRLDKGEYGYNLADQYENDRQQNLYDEKPSKSRWNEPEPDLFQRKSQPETLDLFQRREETKRMTFEPQISDQFQSAIKKPVVIDYSHKGQGGSGLFTTASTLENDLQVRSNRSRSPLRGDKSIMGNIESFLNRDKDDDTDRYNKRGRFDYDQKDQYRKDARSTDRQQGWQPEDGRPSDRQAFDRRAEPRRTDDDSRRSENRRVDVERGDISRRDYDSRRGREEVRRDKDWQSDPRKDEDDQRTQDRRAAERRTDERRIDDRRGGDRRSDDYHSRAREKRSGDDRRQEDRRSDERRTDSRLSNTQRNVSREVEDRQRYGRLDDSVNDEPKGQQYGHAQAKLFSSQGRKPENVDEGSEIYERLMSRTRVEVPEKLTEDRSRQFSNVPPTNEESPKIEDRIRDLRNIIRSRQQTQTKSEIEHDLAKKSASDEVKLVEPEQRQWNLSRTEYEQRNQFQPQGPSGDGRSFRDQNYEPGFRNPRQDTNEGFGQRIAGGSQDPNERNFKNFYDGQNALNRSPPGRKPQQSANRDKVASFDDLFKTPGRFYRPKKLVVILRGLPGSGKTHLARAIKTIETSYGQDATRILSLDDYFECDGQYQYEEELEPSYKASLVRSFRKQIDEGFFNFIIVDSVNSKTSDYQEMWSHAKLKGFEVFICDTLEKNPKTCFQKNVHHRTLNDISKILSQWETAPSHFNILDIKAYMQDQEIECVEMLDPEPDLGKKDATEQEGLSDDDEDSTEGNSDNPFKLSKWEVMDDNDKMARLDGVSESAMKKMADQHSSIEDWLDLDSLKQSNPIDKFGKKRVRWADIEERKAQVRMRDVGFIVGHTNWNRMMDPTEGQAALTRTKIIPNRFQANS